MKVFIVLFAACCAAVPAGAFAAPPWPLTAASDAVLATKNEAAALLGAADEFTRRLSAFDRAARCKLGADPGDAIYRRLVAQQALPFTAADAARLGRVLGVVRAKLAPFAFPLPGRVVFVKTTGREEGNAPYTRGSAVVLPLAEFAKDERELARTVLHELFHIMTRHDAARRTALYRVIGFTPCPELVYPAEWAALRITNPDGIRADHLLRLTHGGRPVDVVPILYANRWYEAGSDKEFFEYLEPALVEVRLAGGRTLVMPGRPLIPVENHAGYTAKVGRNTEYLIHPDEILADNFVLLALGGLVKDPWVLDGMRKVLGR